MSKKLFLLVLITFMLLNTLTSKAQQPAATHTATTSADSMHVLGNTIVDGDLIVKHIKSPDGILHIGSNSMTFNTLVNQNNPIKGVSTYTYESQSTSLTTSGIAIGWNASAAA